jgi:hypothetical protein
MSADNKPTSGAEMRANREQGQVVLFPSGNYYRVRWSTAASLLRRGNLPNVLLSFVVDALYKGLASEKVDAFLSLRDKEDNAQDFLASLKVLAEDMWMEPKIVETPQADDEISIADLPIIDQAFAFDICFRPAKEVLPFRDEQKIDVESMATLEDSAQTGKRRSRTR